MDRPRLTRDALFACMLALVLGIGWTWADWSALSAMRLPDTDDVMRLQQVRDWLGGQRFADLVQHRLGDGVAMHWSRLADLGPALLIVTLRGVLGAHLAELTAVIAWPLALFAVALLLVARIARAVNAPAATATVIAALAYPATTVFLPGRIDHHGLQVVLLLAALLATLWLPPWRSGIGAGVAIAASVTIGLETAPVLAMLCGFVLGEAALGRPNATERLGALGFGLCVALLAARGIFATEAWSYPACDGFTADSWRAALVGGAGFMLSAIVLRWLRSQPQRRIAAGMALGPLTGIVALAASPRCIVPYGGVDPELARWWLARVGEAQPLFSAPAAVMIGYGGVIAAGLLATGWRFAHRSSRGWGLLAALQISAAAVTLVQVRGAYGGAMLGAPALAFWVAAARRRGPLRLAAAWAGSAGMLYPIAARALTPEPRTAAGLPCTAPDVMARLAPLAGTVLMAPIDVGPEAIAATRLRAVAGPYHRDTAGDLAMLRFFRADPAMAHVVARRWRVGYVLLCDADARDLAATPGSLAARIVNGHTPDWLLPLAPIGPGVHLFAMRHAR